LFIAMGSLGEEHLLLSHSGDETFIFARLTHTHLQSRQISFKTSTPGVVYRLSWPRKLALHSRMKQSAPPASCFPMLTFYFLGRSKQKQVLLSYHGQTGFGIEAI